MRDWAAGFWVYIMANRRNGAIYTGHTDDLYKRVEQHRRGAFPGFTHRYGCKTLVWAEWHETRDGAFRRERRIKEWRRSWKLLLIEERNPTWDDMLDAYIGGGLPDVWNAPTIGDGDPDEDRFDPTTPPVP